MGPLAPPLPAPSSAARVGLALGAEYDIQRWLTLGADDSETRRFANFENFPYRDSIVGIKATLKF